VKVLVQVVVNGAQLLVYINVTVVEPPQIEGGPWLLFDKLPLQPPLAFAAASHAANCALTSFCVWQEATVKSAGQLSTTGAGAGTVKVLVQLVGG
jgi:hypothetical protein